jgi:hypothetical protein
MSFCIDNKYNVLLLVEVRNMVVKYSHPIRKSSSGGSDWVFTKRRQDSLKKAQIRHVQLVKAGKRVLSKS